jgi:hypothetical protein
MPKKAQIGRPPLPKGQVRKNRLFCRVSRAELGAIENAANKERKATSVWVRAVLLAAASSAK